MDSHVIPAAYQAAADLLAGKIILVTGAGDGIGRVAAECYAAHGATVVLLGRTVAKLEAVYDAIEAAGGAQPALFPLDLATATEEDYNTLAAALEQTFGRLDGLLHNAGLLGERRPLASASAKAWNEVMQVNVNAAFLLTRATLPLLEQAPEASIIFTSSGVGRRGRAYWGAYAVSKFATEGLMQVLADELENTSRIRVNSLNPGATNTAMRRSAYPGETPTDNPDPAALMPTYLYLMGADSTGITGQAFDAQG
ncbi:YciK family oxidoreductase [Kineobactrum salinum]|uniref:YciK family oxidoreductase n=2 Tax=Kineobactrum salinum TaxID=2708301 RepID=A0A6C0U8V2_9GAMM|nr:YciK family oxidoreductase [Kineobactrum salinum]